MKKREFLAMGGAVPLILSGCGGGGDGTATVRLVNASVGYPTLGLTIGDTDVTTTDVAYGAVSPFAGAPAGSQTTTLTTTSSTGVVTDLPVTTRTLAKDTRYSLVGYGYAGSPKSVLIVENQDAPTSGYAKFNVLNTSTDIGAVDIYLSASTDLSVATPIASSIGGVSQSVFAEITAGTYVVTVVGAGSVARGVTDIRFQVSGVALADQQISTLILTPGGSGVLANAILLTQGDAGTAVNYPNSLSRVRVVAATGNSGVVAVLGVLPAVTSPNISGYVLVASGVAPAVQYNGATLPNAGTLAPGADYTLVVYLNAEAAATTSLIFDDNRLPTVSTSCKVRLLNVVYDPDPTQPLALTLNVNAATIASNVPYPTASTYTEIPALTTSTSTIQVSSGFTPVLPDQSITLTSGAVYTQIVAGQGSPVDVSGIVGKFLSARV